MSWKQDPTFWTPLETGRLLLRRPEETDRTAAVRLHADPRTNAHNPGAVTESAADRTFRAFLRHWRAEGFGYWAVTLAGQPEEIIGFTGVRLLDVAGQPALNLYYRYDPSAWGRGYATEGAVAAVRQARLHLPELPVVARTTADNLGSQKTALAAGLERRPDLDIDHGAWTEVFFTAPA